MPEIKKETAGGARLLATFVLRNSLFAFDASRVQEVIRLGAVTCVRHAPEDVAGVINLRGRIVTLLDLGHMLGFGKAETSRDSRIFIVEDRGEFLGLLVDQAGDVIEANLSATQARFFRGVQRFEGRVIALLDLNVLLPAMQ
jgi:purine-binding chemotaxis protein CheW